jgi:plasmid stabilization system protein ParE
MKPRFLDEATAELDEATFWYERRRAGLGGDFYKAVEDAIAEIIATPDRFPFYEGDRSTGRHRRFLLKRFPYFVVYEILSEELLIVSISHSSRMPGYWRGR